MITTIKKNIFVQLFFYIALLYILMRPFLMNYVSEYYKHLFILITIAGTFSALFIEKSLKKIGNVEICWLMIFYIYVLLNALLFDGSELLVYTIEGYCFYTLPIFIIPCLASKINWKKLLFFLSLFGIINAAISILEFTTRKCMFPLATMKQEADVAMTTVGGDLVYRTYGLNGNYFLLAEILCVCGFASLFLFKFERIKWQIILWGIITIGLLSTGTRGFYVAYALGTAFIYIFDKNGISKNNLRRICLCAFIALIAFYVIVKSKFTTGNENVDIILKRIRMIFDWQYESANKGRIEVWRKSILYWRKSFWFGHGACCTRTDYSKYVGVTESGILKRLVELGLIGTILQYVSMFIPIKKGIKKAKYGLKNKHFDEMYVFFFAILIAFFTEDIILQRYCGTEFTIIIWTSIAYLAYSDMRPNEIQS